MESSGHIRSNSETTIVENIVDPTLKVICLDLDETLIHATRVACNNTGSKQLKFWGQCVSRCREKEMKELLKDKPLDCLLNDEEYLRSKYGPPLFEDNPDIASPFRWAFPADDFSQCWTLIRCYNEQHKMTSFYRIEYRPYCQHLMEIINKYKKHCNVKVVISTMATRQYGTLVCEGFKLFKGYFENINGTSKPFIDEFVGLEDWREKCWDRRYPRHYGKKSLPYIGMLLGIDPSHIIAIDDKPQIWSNMRQVIYAVPYNGGIYLQDNIKENSDENSFDENANNNGEVNQKLSKANKTLIDKQKNDDSNSPKKINDVLYKIAKYLESYLCHTLGVLSKQRRSSDDNKKKYLKLRLQLSNPVVATFVKNYNHGESSIKSHSKRDSSNHDIRNTRNRKMSSVRDNKTTFVTA